MLKMLTLTIGMEQDKDGERISESVQAENKRMTMSYLSDLFGGVTVIESEGAWMNGKGELVIEKGITVKTAIDMKSRSISDVFAIVENINVWHKQEAIMLEFDGSVYFI